MHPMNTTDTHITALILGDTGKTGRRVVARLNSAGHSVRVGSRSAAVPFDWDDRSTWAELLHDVDAAYIVYAPDVSIPGADEQVGAFAKLARQSGVRRLVLLSGRGEQGAINSESSVRSAFPDATIVTASWFAQNFSEDFLADFVAAGDIALPAGTVAEPFVDAEDIADIVASALTTDDHQGKRYEVTGPRLLTLADVAADLTAATGRTITYTPVTAEESARRMTQQGVAPELIEMLTHLFTEVLDGRNASLADGVQQALGRPPRDFAAYARDAAGTGAI
jgi:uncharacterized protein YbjT (DUF2867 family)